MPHSRRTKPSVLLLLLLLIVTAVIFFFPTGQPITTTADRSSTPRSTPPADIPTDTAPPEPQIPPPTSASFDQWGHQTENFPAAADAPETIRIAAWNIRDLSVSTRDQAERQYIAQVIRNFDAVAITETNDTEILDALEIVLEASGGGGGQDWESITSPKVGETSYSAEHYGVLFRDDRLDLTDAWALPDHRLADLDILEPGELDYLDGEPDRRFNREPYAVLMATDDGRLDFALVIAHVTWGARVGPRIAETRALGWYYRDVSARERDVLVLGDFNRNAGDSKSLGWLAERFGLIDTTSPDTPTKIDSNNTYDHILLHPVHTTEYQGSRGVVLFDEELFGGDDGAAKKALSDHRPVWVELVVPVGDDD